MASLEMRLAETEGALAAALSTLQEQKDIEFSDDKWQNSLSTAQAKTSSKAEKLDEWKRLPLASKEQLFTWLQDKQANRASGNSRSTTLYNQTISTANATTAMDILERLRICDQPPAPNLQGTQLGSNDQWRDNYF